MHDFTIIHFAPHSPHIHFNPRFVRLSFTVLFGSRFNVHSSFTVLCGSFFVVRSSFVQLTRMHPRNAAATGEVCTACVAAGVVLIATREARDTRENVSINLPIASPYNFVWVAATTGSIKNRSATALQRSIVRAHSKAPSP